MNSKMEQADKALLQKALNGEKEALAELLGGVQDMVFNLSLRMLGMPEDAEDAAQAILIKVMTHLGAFRGESALTTWVFRIAVNHLRDYRKGMFAQRPLSFEYYGEDIASGRERDVPDLADGADQNLLAEELKLSCTNVMLQCLDADSRCAFILGTMFRADSRIAGEILDITPVAYRQRLSRARKKMAEFLSVYCGHQGGICQCARRVNYAIATRRLDPGALCYTKLEADRALYERFIENMEQFDSLSTVFDTFPLYRSTEHAKEFLSGILASDAMRTVLEAKAAGE